MDHTFQVIHREGRNNTKFNSLLLSVPKELDGIPTIFFSWFVQLLQFVFMLLCRNLEALVLPISYHGWNIRWPSRPWAWANARPLCLPFRRSWCILLFSRSWSHSSVITPFRPVFPNCARAVPGVRETFGGSLRWNSFWISFWWDHDSARQSSKTGNNWRGGSK